MEPNQDIKKLLKINFTNTDSYYDIKTKLVSLEEIICHSLDYNIIEGSFTKALTLFITRNKIIKRACIPHFKKMRKYVKNISQDITHLFYINDKDIVKITLKFVKIFAKFYCNNSVLIYHVLHTKSKYKYKVLNSFILRNNNLLGLFEYNKIIQDTYVKDLNLSDSDDIATKRFKLNQNQPKKSVNSTNFFQRYAKTIKTLRKHYLNQNKNNIFEFLKVGEIEQIENENSIKKLFSEEDNSEIQNSFSSIDSKFSIKMTQNDFKTEIENLKTTFVDYKDYIICSYFSDLINEKNVDTTKYVFDIKNGVLSPSLAIKFHSLVYDKSFIRIERIFSRLFRNRE